MPVVYRFSCPLPNGLHARPASELAEVARRTASAVTFVNERNTRSANVRSVLALVATDTRAGDPCRLEISGADEADAARQLATFIDHALAATDTPLATVVAGPTEILIPRSLRAAGLTAFHAGNAASRGIGRGRAVAVGGLALPPQIASEIPQSAAAEQIRFDAGLRALAHEYDQQLQRARGQEAEIVRAHAAILGDPGLTDAVAAAIREGRSAGQALVAVAAAQRAALEAAASAYVRERAFDVEDIVARLCEKIYGMPVIATPRLDGSSIIFAEHLTPSQFLALERRHVAGLVLEHAGQTSHVIILARSFGIPTLTGVAEAGRLGRAATDAIVDAGIGLVVVDPPSGVRRYYDRELDKLAAINRSFAALRDQPAQLVDGERLEVGANIATVDEAVAAFAQGAEGIGLFRTELLFANRETAPTEEEQYEAYAAVVRAAAGRPVIIRTLDIGGDKPVAFLPQPEEPNPFLGCRGVRLYADNAALITTQLRAIVRAAALGPVKLLVPMITSVEEAQRIRAWLGDVVSTLGSAAAVPLGFMIEVPATAFVLPELCALADFFSIGTNDLAQYFAAADRENSRVAALNSPFQPAFLRLLKHVVDTVHAHDRWIGLCGELAENPAALPLLAGLGLDEISLAAPRIPATKAALARLSRTAGADLLRKAAACATRAEVDAVIAAGSALTLPLLTPELVLDGVEAASKEEVIRALVDALHVSGRTQEPAVVEESVWRREEAYSTGFGEGFALPHCKTDALAANTIAIARLRTPVEWNALDGKPVDTVILLGIRASDHDRVHMQVLARLSRLVMRDEFRDALRGEKTSLGVVSLLTDATAAPAVASR